MKGILEFNLDEPDDVDQFKYAQAGLQALLLLEDLDNEFRSKMKHDCGEFKDCDFDTIETVRKYIWELRHDRKLPELT